MTLYYHLDYTAAMHPRPSQVCGLTLVNSLEGLAELYLAMVQALAVSYLLGGIASLPDCSF